MRGGFEFFISLFLALAHEVQNVLEHRNEADVKVKGSSPTDTLKHVFRCVWRVHFFHRLRLPCSQTSEENNTNTCDHVAHHVILEEDVQHTRTDNSPNTHHDEALHRT